MSFLVACVVILIVVVNDSVVATGCVVGGVVGGIFNRSAKNK